MGCLQRTPWVDRGLWLILAACAPWALAQSDAGPAVGGLPYGECGLSYGSSNRNLDAQTGVASGLCMLSLRPRISPQVIAGLNLRLGWHDQPGADTSNARFREAYLDWDNDTTAVRLGRQIISWGRADSLNPTDKLDPKNFTLLGTDDDGQRQGLDALTLRQAVGPHWSVTAVAAEFSPHVLPLGALPAATVMASTPNGTEWAVKLDHSGQGVDGSVSYFDGFERGPRYSVDLSNPAAPLFRGDFERAQSLGADFAWATGMFTWRGEFSHTALQPQCAACGTAQRHVSRAVVGGDIELPSGLNFNAQFFATQNHDYVDPTALAPPMRSLQGARNLLNREFAAWEQGVTLRLSDRLLNDKLKWEISAVADTTGNSWLIRPRLAYAFGDRVKLTVGADLYEGDAQSYFGTLTQNRVVFAMLSFVL